ncbi:MAG TPA: META domain-containing protein, partial [Pseudoxanthomonas sp.]|nr:META domain-containing protein [Pseudoxanthomonas sp.]
MKRHLIFVFPLALAACAKPPQGESVAPPAASAAMAGTPAMPAALSAYHWRLTDAKDAKGQRIESLFVNADKPLQLDFEAGRVGIGNTCNHMGGAYSVRGDQLKLERIASTMMACADNRLMALDQEAARRLQGASTFVLQPGVVPTLTLTTGGGDVLVLKGEPTAETRHGGP